MEAIVDEPPAPVLEVGAEGPVVVAVVAEVEAEADELLGELLHPASPRADADNTTSDQVRRRDMKT
jgi:hypothetical protein